MKFIDEIKKPFNIVMMVLAIASVSFTTCFYFMSIKERKPVYHVLESIKIFDSKNTSPKIQLLDKNSKPIDEDVYVRDIIIWNEGELPIDQEHIRDPLKLILTGQKKLLDFQIADESNPLISKFEIVKLLKDDTKINSETLKLSWKYFDPGFAVKIRLFYTGNGNLDIMMKGNILNVSKIKPKYTNTKKFGKHYIILLIMYSLLLPVIVYMFFRMRGRNYSSHKKYVFMLVSII